MPLILEELRTISLKCNYQRRQQPLSRFPWNDSSLTSEEPHSKLQNYLLSWGEEFIFFWIKPIIKHKWALPLPSESRISIYVTDGTIRFSYLRTSYWLSWEHVCKGSCLLGYCGIMIIIPDLPYCSAGIRETTCMNGNQLHLVHLVLYMKVVCFSGYHIFIQLYL